MSLPENFHPHSRYVLKEAPWGYNASDLIHRDISGPVFDLGVDLEDRHGIAYIRVSDVEEMARVLGMATRDEVKALKNQIKELNAEVTNVPREVEKLKDGLDDLVSDFLHRVVVGDSADIPVPSVDSGEEIEGQSELPFGDSDEDVSGSESQSAESIESARNEHPASRNKRPAKLSGSSVDEFGLPT